MKTNIFFRQATLMLFAIMFNSFNSTAQDTTCPDNLLINGEFNATCSNFNTTCLQNWSVAGGSPQIFGLPSSPYAWMWSTQGTGEAISGGFNFVTGVTYDISFRVRATDGNVSCENTGITSIINVMASNSPGGVTASPNGEVIFQSNSGPYLGGWSTVSVQFTPTVNASNIWIFPYQAANNCRIDLSIDDICITEANSISEDGAFCCDESENLVQNGNFEYGDTGFTSDYTQNGATLPGQYDVTNSAAAFGASVTDHSFCEDPSLYNSNNKYLVVNGKTTQASGSESMVWKKSLNLDPEKEYRFCANFKNMPQCTFDILPQIEIITNTGYSETATINVDPNDPCAWQTVSFCFRGDEDMDFSITLKEDGLGDGNDLAIDDIAVSELIDPELAISVLHQGNPQQVTASINTISTSDDALPYDQDTCDEPYFWYAITLSGFTGGTYQIDFNQPYAWGNNTGFNIFNPSPIPDVSGSNPWNLTTTFPNYNFEQNTLYLIGMTTPSCCLDCVDEGLTYQIIYNNRMSTLEFDINEANEAWIKSWLGTYAPTLGTSRTQETQLNATSLLQVFPNPAKSKATIALLESDINTINIYTLTGQNISQIIAPANTRSHQIDISNLNSGVYMIKVLTADNQTMTSRLIVE